MQNDDLSMLVQAARDGHKQVEEALALFRYIGKLFQALAFVLAFPWILLLHFSIGERVLRGPLVFCSFVVLIFVAGFSATVFGGIFVFIYLIAVIGHLYHAHRRSKKGIRWHSYSLGLCWVGLVEPRMLRGMWGSITSAMLLVAFSVVNAIVGDVLAPDANHGVFSFYVFISAFAYLVVQRILFNRMRNAILDQMDQKIVSEVMAKALEPKADPRDNYGFEIPITALTSAERELLLSQAQDANGHADVEPVEAPVDPPDAVAPRSDEVVPVGAPSSVAQPSDDKT